MPAKPFSARVAVVTVAAMLTLSLSGCYYLQATRGHLELMGKREPIADLISDPATSAELVRRLELVSRARDFSIAELGLPDNDSYRSYADLERNEVLWNVFAAPEFSVRPKSWCYPIVGCVAYRGYFRKAAAEKLARRLREDGFDVFMGPVTAYSTLGRFDDPVLNTMLRWDDIQLVSVLFHELAHQVLYIRDDTAFNESFATAVEEIGVERFLAAGGIDADFDRYRERKHFRRRLMRLVDAARADLESLYDEPLDPRQMRTRKAWRIATLTQQVREMLADTGRDAEAWLEQPFNNARIASFALYEGWLPAFREMLARCAGVLACFYAEAERVSQLEKTEREAFLEDLTREWPEPRSPAGEAPNESAAATGGLRAAPSGTGVRRRSQLRSAHRSIPPAGG